MATLLPREDGQEVLCQSFVGQEIWSLLESGKQEEFKRRVREYFALGMPHYEVVKVRPSERKIFLRRKDGA